MRYGISSNNIKYRGVETTVDTSDFSKKCKNKEYRYLLDLLFEYISVSDEQNSVENFDKMKKLFVEFREHGVECEIIAYDSKPMQDLYGYPLELLGIDIVLEEAESLLADDVPLIVKRELNENGLCKTETDVARFIPYLDHGVDIWEPCYVYKVIC